MKTYYELLAIERDAGPEVVKRAFRHEIARYHPDKVQHLGPEFQEIAATRAAELTEAYRILMDPVARAAYDASIGGGEPGRPSPGVATAPPPTAAPDSVRASEPGQNAKEPVHHVPETLRETQATLSVFVRRATIGRLRDTVAALAGETVAVPADGFDMAFVLKPRRGIFQKSDPPVHVMARVVPTVDAAAIEGVWPMAMRATKGDGLACVLLLGQGIAPARQLAAAIAEQRRRTRQTVPPIVVPVDLRDWDPLLPPETPSSVRKLLERLKLGA